MIKNNKREKEMVTEMRTRIDINKQEAKLLLSVSKFNLDVLELCESIKYVDSQKIVSPLTERLEKTHIQISENYNKLANEKLISIPSYTSRVNDFELENIDHNSFIETKLKLIIDKLESQIQLLDTLGKTTTNNEFKVLTIRDTRKLNSNINDIEITLNRLYKRVKNM